MMKLYSIELGIQLYEIEYTSTEIRKAKVNETLPYLKDIYIAHCKQAERTCLRITMYERDETTGTIVLLEEFKWDCIKVRPRVLNNPGKRVEID